MLGFVPHPDLRVTECDRKEHFSIRYGNAGVLDR